MIRAIQRSARRALRRNRRPGSAPARSAGLGVEMMEPRLLLSVQPVLVGSVYVEEDLGSDMHGDTFYLTFQGGAPGTQLTHVEINGDQNAAGFNVGDVFFDTNSDNSGTGFGRFGADGSFDFQVISQDGIDAVRAFVDDGTSLLRLEFTGFDAGDRLVFSIDVDEVEDYDPAESDVELINDGFDPITSGVEFQGSTFAAGFKVADFEDLEVQSKFLNRYDPQLDGTGLQLPADDGEGKRDRTAGAVADGQQVVIPASLSGHVYHDANRNGHRDAGETGLAGVSLQAIPLETVVDQAIATVVTDQNGHYRFDALMPGRYRVVEAEQPAGYIDWLDSAGTVDGDVVGHAVNPGDLIDDVLLPGGSAGIDYDFGEILPVSIRGTVHLSTSDGDCFSEDVAHAPLANVVVRLLDQDGQSLSETTTDAQGRYEFVDLLPGVYKLFEVTPSGLIEGGARAGRIDGVWDDQSVIVDASTISGIQLDSGEAADRFDFCEHPPSSLSGFVYHDQNDDGFKAADEQGVADVIVQLVDEAGNLVSATLTDDSGAYRFENLHAGNYQLIELHPQDWLDGKDTAGTIGAQTVGRAINPGDRIEQIVVGWGQSGVDYNFGELLPTDIFGSVHLSTIDGDCFGEEVDHEPLADVIVQLLDVSGQVVRETRTDARGEYAFRGLAPGRYGVRELTPDHLLDGGAKAGTINGLPAGVVFDTNTVLQIDLRSGQQIRDVEFCEHEPATLSGHVYHDRNDDGQRGSGEEGIADVTVILFDGGSREVARTQTDAEGFYQFDRLLRDEYRVVEQQPDGWQDGLDRAGLVDGVPAGRALNPGDEIRQISLGWGQSGVDYDFGELRPSSLSGRVLADLNDDCELQANEWTLAGVTIQLYDSNGQLVATQVTDDDGEFQFRNLRPDSYTLREIQPAEYFTAGQKAGSGGGDDRVPNVISQIAISSGQDWVDYHFCEEPPSSISGYVYQDGPRIELGLNQTLPSDLTEIRDGQLTDDDTRLVNVVLELRDGIDGTPIDASVALPGHYSQGPIRTSTDPSGYYEFRGLPAGNYAVFEVQPAGYLDGIDTDGTVPAIAINRHNIKEIEPQVMAALKYDPNFDAIIRISLYPHVDAQENNFSEIQVSRAIVPPGAVPAPAPVPPPVTIEWEPMTFVDRPVEPLTYQLTPYGRLRGVLGSTWHLSVMDGGTPRGPGVTVPARGPVWLSQSNDDEYHVAWHDAAAQQMYWTLVVDGQPQRERIFGVRQGIPLAGDFNGDGIAEIGVFYEGQWFVDLNGNGRWDDEDLWARLGHYGDQPVVGDWDGDGKDDIGVFGLAWAGDPQAVRREPGLPDKQNETRGQKNVPPQPEETTRGRRDLRLSANGRTRSDVIDHVFHFGVTGHQAVVGDWNGDGIANIGVFDKGTWHLDQDGDGEFTDQDREVEFGHEGDIPIAGDFNGDGIDEIGIMSNGRIVLDLNRNYRIDEGDQVISVGSRSGRPVVGDWNGDGVDDVAMTYEELRFVEVDARQ